MMKNAGAGGLMLKQNVTRKQWSVLKVRTFCVWLCYLMWSWQADFVSSLMWIKELIVALW